MKGRTYLLLIILVLIFSCKTENKDLKKNEIGDVYNTNGLIWESIDNITKLDTTGSKKFLIDIYTEWCSWCKVMDKKTFSDPIVQEVLKSEFHLLKFNAERLDSIQFKGEKYGPVRNGRRQINALAMKLLGGKLSYPALVYFDKNLKTIRVSQGYKNSEELLQEIEVITKS